MVDQVVACSKLAHFGNEKVFWVFGGLKQKQMGPKSVVNFNYTLSVGNQAHNVDFWSPGGGRENLRKWLKAFFQTLPAPHSQCVHFCQGIWHWSQATEPWNCADVWAICATTIRGRPKSTRPAGQQPTISFRPHCSWWSSFHCCQHSFALTFYYSTIHQMMIFRTHKFTIFLE